jgi:hypothetical protein
MGKVIKLPNCKNTTPMEAITEVLYGDLIRDFLKDHKGLTRINLITDRYGRTFWVDQYGVEMIPREEMMAKKKESKNDKE